MPTDIQMPKDIAESPLGERFEFMLKQMRYGDVDLSDEKLSSVFVTGPNFPPLHMTRTRLQGPIRRLGEFTVTGYERIGEFMAFANISDTRNRYFCLAIGLEKEEPFRIYAYDLFSDPPGASARLATESDAEALHQIELKTPLIVENTEITYDRGSDYFQAERLMGNAITFIVEKGGVPVGFRGRVAHNIRIGGNVWNAIYVHRFRLLPEAQRGGIFDKAIRAMYEYHESEYSSTVNYAFMAAGNILRSGDKPKQNFTFNHWPVFPERIVIDTEKNAGEPMGIPATSKNATLLATLFNATHDQEELYNPYTVESLTSRLTRESNAYSWGDIVIAKNAALGIWRAGLGVKRETDGSITNDVRALVLDFGCDPGAEEELVDLIRSACGILTEEGHTELSIFTSPPSPAYSELAALAKRKEPYVVSCYIDWPEENKKKGVYVDQLYF